jgi:hypothetical protein
MLHRPDGLGTMLNWPEKQKRGPDNLEGRAGPKDCYGRGMLMSARSETTPRPLDRASGASIRSAPRHTQNKLSPLPCYVASNPTSVASGQERTHCMGGTAKECARSGHSKLTVIACAPWSGASDATFTCRLATLFQKWSRKNLFC